MCCVRAIVGGRIIELQYYGILPDGRIKYDTVPECHKYYLP